MTRKKETLLLFSFVIEVFVCGEHVVHDGYMAFPNKRLMNNVITTVKALSTFHCTTWCSMTDGCLAVNVIRNHDIICELLTGPGNENDIQESHNSEIFVSRRLIIQDYKKCVKEPGFCLNGATCEQTWTSARCHCAERYQGDRCEQCAQNYYGDDCEISFTSYPGKKCTGTNLDKVSTDDSGNYDNCKEWCADRSDCGGFTVDGGNCHFKPCDIVIDYSGKEAFRKTLM